MIDRHEGLRRLAVIAGYTLFYPVTIVLVVALAAGFKLSGNSAVWFEISRETSIWLHPTPSAISSVVDRRVEVNQVVGGGF